MSIVTVDDIKANSVTRDDPDVLNPGGRPSLGGVLYLSFGQPYLGTPTGVLPYELPLPWSRVRDRILITTVLHESMWAAAVQKTITKQAALGFTVEDRAKNERRAAIGQERLLSANGGRGFVPFLFQHLGDYLLTDNGAFVELVYRTEYLRSQFLGFVHLDGLRCTRTGDPDIPVVYEDLRGRYHELRAHQVLTFVDMETARAEGRGTGICAASRAYQTVHKMAAMERYVDEKISGTRANEIHIVNGISDQQMRGALQTADQQQLARGYVNYKGVVVIPATKMDAAIGGYRIPIAEVPDGFDPKLERDNAYLIYANCLGVPVTDVQPLSGQGLGTGTQSVVIDEAAEGQGMAAWRKQWEHAANLAILPSSTTFTWTNVNDKREQKAQADINAVWATVVVSLVEKGVLNTSQGLQLLADQKVVPDTFLNKDETPDDALTDTEKPVTEGEQDRIDAEATAPLPTEAEVIPVVKEDWMQEPRIAYKPKGRITDPATLFDDDALLAAATRLAEEAKKNGIP